MVSLNETIQVKSHPTLSYSITVFHIYIYIYPIMMGFFSESSNNANIIFIVRIKNKSILEINSTIIEPTSPFA